MHRKSVIVLVVTSLVLSFALAACGITPPPRLHPLKNLQILRLQPLNPKAGP